MYEQPPPKQRAPDDTRSILKICEWMRSQPNGHSLDLPDLDLLPILEPPTLREHFRSLLPIPKNREQVNREQINREQSKTLLPIFKPPKNREQNREQIGTDPTQSHLVETDDDRRIVKVNGENYIFFQSTKSLVSINQPNGWLDIKPSPNKRHLYLCLRWREGTTQRSKHLGKVVKAV